MDSLIIKGTENTPGVTFDVSSNQFIISGRSRPENAGQFFFPIINWITTFEKTLTKEQSTLVFEFKLEYFNSTSAKHLAEIILLLKDFILKGHKIKIEWHFAKFDDDMLDTGKEFSNMADLKFDFIEY